MRPLLLLLAVAPILVTPSDAKDPARASDNNSPSKESKTGKMELSTQVPATRFYGNAEYLLWWVKDAPLSVPLISSGPGSNKEGFLVSSATTILYGAPFSPAVGGNNSQSFPAFSGSRLTLGYWLNDDHRLAIEGSGFALESQSAGVVIRGSAGGSPGMRIPVYNNVPYAPGGASDPETGLKLVPKTEDGVPISIPGDLTGGARVSNTLRLWGADLNGVINLRRSSSWEVSALAGVRYLDLTETLSTTADIEGLSTSQMYAGQAGFANDRFKTWNHFYGANLGIRGRYTTGRLSAEMTGRVALGVNNEVVKISGGYEAINFKAPTASGPEGIFAQPANEGRYSQNRFSIVPQAQVKLAYAITPRLSATVSYDILYMSSVVRPGDQINRDIPKGQTFQQDGTAANTSSPSRIFRASDFFAQGLSFGFEFRF